MNRTLPPAGLMVAILAVLAGGCGGGSAPDPATVRGTLLDDGTLRPVAEATVSVGSESTTSARDGSFSLPTQSGQRTISITAAGYQDRTINRNLPAGTSNLGTLYLRPALRAGQGAVRGAVTRNGAAEAGATLRSGNAQARSKDDGSYAIYALGTGRRAITAISADGTQTGWACADVSDGEITGGVDIELGLEPPQPPEL